MSFEHARRHGLDRVTVRDVALLVLVGLGRASREPDDDRAACAQRAYQLGTDARARSGDDGYLQTLSTRPAAAEWPAASVTVARSLCVPALSFAVCHVTE
jgi:hypothetical protein